MLQKIEVKAVAEAIYFITNEVPPPYLVSIIFLLKVVQQCNSNWTTTSCCLALGCFFGLGCF
jgi:hypothetical protein